MIEPTRISSTALGVIATCCLVMAGCAGVQHKKAAEPVPTAVPAVAVVPEVPTIPEPTMAAPAAVVPPAVIQPARPAPTVAPAPRVAVPQAPVSTAPAPKVTAAKPPATAAAPVPPAVPKAATATAPAPAPVASKPAQAPLDLASLGARLKQTKAIGMFTKLSLKNQVDDLLEKFRAYHRQQGTATLPELRRSYDMLLFKVLSLLQDSDAPLARDIVQSRAAIWSILADPRKFNEASLMAGATT